MATWHYITNGKKFGPLDDNAIRQYIASESRPTDKFLHSESNEWLFLFEAELFLSKSTNINSRNPEDHHQNTSNLFCSKCNGEIIVSAQYCHSCGAKVSEFSTTVLETAHQNSQKADGAFSTAKPIETSVHTAKQSKPNGIVTFIYLFALLFVFKLLGVLLTFFVLGAIVTWAKIDPSNRILRLLATIGILVVGLLLWLGIHIWVTPAAHSTTHSTTHSPAASASASASPAASGGSPSLKEIFAGTQPEHEQSTPGQQAPISSTLRCSGVNYQYRNSIRTDIPINGISFTIEQDFVVVDGSNVFNGAFTIVNRSNDGIGFINQTDSTLGGFFDFSENKLYLNKKIDAALPEGDSNISDISIFNCF